ncbi:MAG: transcription elongation factor GreA [Clostridia bacterium]
MGNEIYLTQEGKCQLEEKLAFYKTVRRPQVREAIGVAREFGDLSENSEYDQAKEEQGKLEGEIAEMETILRDAVIIDKKKSNPTVIGMGTKVKLLDAEFNEELIYKIVGSTESDPLNGQISNESPVGKALLGKRKGDTIEVETPVGTTKLTILELKA